MTPPPTHRSVPTPKPLLAYSYPYPYPEARRKAHAMTERVRSANSEVVALEELLRYIG